MDFTISLISFLVAIAILVAIHEFGHFYVARLCGVKVLRFSIGFGPVLFSRRDSKDTEYVISLLPLGGYVKMLDEREGEVMAAEQPLAFNRQNVWKRIAIVAAGPIFNFLLAILLFTVIYMVGVKGVAPIIGKVLPDSAAFHAGLNTGDEIVSIDNTKTETWRAVLLSLLGHIGEDKRVVVHTKSPSDDTSRVVSHELLITHDLGQNARSDILKEIGLEAALPNIPPIIGQVEKGSAADSAGLKAGDRVLAIDRVSIKTWFDLVEAVRQSPEKALNLLVQRNNADIPLVVTPQSRTLEGHDKPVGMLGARLADGHFPKDYFRIEQYGVFSAIKAGVVKTWQLSVLTVEMAYKMITGKADLSHLSGPVSIAQGAGQSAQAGFTLYLSFLALISVSLGVINLLPIPILDGGHLLYYTIEVIIRRPVPEFIQQAGAILGLCFLFCVMALAVYNDVIHFGN